MFAIALAAPPRPSISSAAETASTAGQRATAAKNADEACASVQARGYPLGWSVPKANTSPSPDLSGKPTVQELASQVLQARMQARSGRQLAEVERERDLMPQRRAPAMSKVRKGRQARTRRAAEAQRSGASKRQSASPRRS